MGKKVPYKMLHILYREDMKKRQVNKQINAMDLIILIMAMLENLMWNGFLLLLLLLIQHPKVPLCNIQITGRY